MKLLFIIIFMGFYAGLSAQNSDSSILKSDSASFFLTGAFQQYNPQRAFQIYMSRALNGEKEAMNAVGILYSKGIGVEKNMLLSEFWFKKSALAGYHKAWVNLGMLKKTCSTDSLGYSKAVDCFKIAVIHQETSAYYALGYMYYKGLGCGQDYHLALSHFKAGSAKGRPDCLYFIGLCFKYGNGVTANADSATCYIDSAARMGYRQANNELYFNLQTVNNNSAKSRKKSFIPTYQLENALDPFEKIEKQKSFFAMDGEYDGTMVEYDYSGKKVLCRQRVHIELVSHGATLVGIWQFANGDSVHFEAVQSGNNLIFTPNTFSESIIAAKGKKQLYVLKSAQFSLAQFANDTFTLKGNIQLFNTYTRETGSPINVVLKKISKEKLIIPDLSVAVYPNPVSGNAFNIELVLPKSYPVKIGIYNSLGQLLYTHITGALPIGKSVFRVDYNFPRSGVYLIKVLGGNVEESIAIIKE